ncbi:MAG: hypothetical protein HOV96_22735 [Nonomuraea sp.]|nr:hypothetical protein [Nonomuraea sp.]NUP80362.1 hypothetical protein [Nonomuraea sp.]
MGISERVLRYLGSTRNIAGCVAALLGFAAHLFGAAGAYWPVVVAALYGAGALLAPPERTRLTISHTATEPAALRDDLDALLRRIEGRFPSDVHAAVDALAEVVRDVLDRADRLAASSDQAHVVAQTIRRYLPASLEAYANLPRGYAHTRRPGRERSAHEELLAQLALLDARLREVADAIHRGDEQALRDQGRFLRDKFGGSDLNLG